MITRPLCKLIFLCILNFSFCIFNPVFAKEYKISSAAELLTVKLAPGDKVILKNREWKDQRLLFKGDGTERSPIILTTETPGVVKLTGNSSLKVEGSWLIVDGMYFTEGYSLKEDVIVVSPKSEHCRITNTAVVNYNHPDKKVDYKWLSLFGHHHRVDHCWLEGKTHQGTTLVVWLDSIPNYDLIDHNYFGQRPDLGVNGGETLRIGTSTWSMFDSKTTVENNVFEHCNGEIEIISNKSCKNILRNNLFYECAGTLTLRHGNDADVYGNYFIGNGLPNTGGIRVIGENHKVHDNYFQDLRGTGLMAAISVMDGLPNPVLTSHWQVKNARIYNNIIINCTENFVVGAGKNQERYLPALNTSFTGNLIYTDQPPVTWVDDSVKINFTNNVLLSQTIAKLPQGFIRKEIKLKKNSPGLFEVNGKDVKPFWLTGNTGPSWKSKMNFPIGKN